MTPDAPRPASDGPRFEHDALPARIVFGAGRARRDLAAEVARLGGQRILLIATPQEESMARRLARPLHDRVVAVCTDVRPHVPVAVAAAARRMAADHDADLLLCIGGGSTTGTAKAVALTSGLPILAVPTTYAGSEVTPVWGMTEGQRKTTGRDPVVLPRTVVYDAELTVSLPLDLSVASGFNAMAHCIEAFWAPGSDPVAEAFAEAGIRALAEGLPGIAADPTDLGARGQTLLGSWLAGAAFAVAGSGLHHKICHVLGGAYDLPHAQLHTVVLPHVLAHNAAAVPDAAARIGRALGGRADGVEDATGRLTALMAGLRAPTALRDLGLAEEDLDDATDLVAAQVPPDNPRPLDRDDVARLLRAAWQGPPGTATRPPTASPRSDRHG